MENIYEESVSRRDTKPAQMFKTLMGVACALSSVLSLAFIISVFGGLPTLSDFALILFFIAIAVVAFVIRNMLFIEMDYALYDDTLDVAKVVNGSKRKELLSVSVKNFDICARMDSYEYKTRESTVEIKINAFVNNDSDLYFALFNDERGKKNMLIFEPSENLLKLIRRRIPSKVVL